MDRCNTIDDPWSAATVYRCTEEGLSTIDASSTSAYSSALEEQPSGEVLQCSQLWTTIDSTTDEDDGDFVRVLPGRKVTKFETNRFKVLDKIGEGGQGTIHTAIYFHSNFVDKSYEQVLQTQVGVEHVPLDVDDDDDEESDFSIYVAKVYKGRRFGQWPEQVFGLHVSCQFVCQYEGYCIDRDTFYLLMSKYDDSLRNVIDKQMKKGNCNGRPLADVEVMRLIIEIALGMRFLHDNNIIHRDLKADNIFILSSQGQSGILTAASYIGDFDVASNVIGTLFWRAPEVLQALKDGERPVFTPKADVYSFAMTCYEILTGGIPFEEIRASDYDVVLSGKRPKLPWDLNPKVKDFMNRCWHQNPEARPPFNDIVPELKELHRELILGSPYFSMVMDSIFDYSQSSLDIVGASPESCLVELKELLQALLVKYNQADFLIVCLEVVAAVEQFQSEFGLRSYKEQPVLPFSMWLSRKKLHGNIKWKVKVFGRMMAYIAELSRISALLSNILGAIDEDSGLASLADENLLAEPERIRIHEANMSDLKAWVEEYHTRVVPDEQHSTCRGNLLQGCDLCKQLDFELLSTEAENTRSYLYVDTGSAAMEPTSSTVSFLKEKVSRLLL